MRRRATLPRVKQNPRNVREPRSPTALLVAFTLSRNRRIRTRLQKALSQLGGVPRLHQTDSMSCAVRNHRGDERGSFTEHISPGASLRYGDPAYEAAESA